MGRGQGRGGGSAHPRPREPRGPGAVPSFRFAQQPQPRAAGGPSHVQPARAGAGASFVLAGAGEASDSPQHTWDRPPGSAFCKRDGGGACLLLQPRDPQDPGDSGVPGPPLQHCPPLPAHASSLMPYALKPRALGQIRKEKAQLPGIQTVRPRACLSVSSSWRTNQPFHLICISSEGSSCKRK